MSDPTGGDLFQPGDVLNNTYRIETLLGRGGMSEVYRARSEVSGRVMAIKALRPEFADNEDVLTLITREEDIRDIRNDAIVRYFDTQRMTNGVVYLVMDYVEGPALDQKMAAGGMSANDLMIVGRRLSEGLVAAHAKKIVHRDLSPDNIILRGDNPEDAVIIDFGIAKDINPGAATIVGNDFAGKLGYAAPEQFQGKTEPRSDIYSLGALLLATFRGTKPNHGGTIASAVKYKMAPLDVEGVPDPFASIISKMTAPNPADRFQSAQDMLYAFKYPQRFLEMEAGLDDEEDATVIVRQSDETIIAPQRDSTVIAPAPENTATAPQTDDTVLAQPSSPKDARNDPVATKRPPRKERLNTPILAVAGVGLVAAIGLGAFLFLWKPIETAPANDVLAQDDSDAPLYTTQSSQPPARSSSAPTVAAEAKDVTFFAERDATGTVRASGIMPSVEAEAQVLARLAALGADAEVTLVPDVVSEEWSARVFGLLNAVSSLTEFRLDVQETTAQITGLAPNKQQQQAILSALAAFPQTPLQIEAEVLAGPRVLQPETLNSFLEAFADCGRLQLQSPPNGGYALGDTITVTGRFAGRTQEDLLRRALEPRIGSRTLVMQTTIEREALCLINQAVPGVGTGGLDVRFGWGDRSGENADATYFVGENPIIDVRLPSDGESGFLNVSLMDVQGIVYHLLPNAGRPVNNLGALLQEAEDGYVRVAYPVGGQNRDRLAFLVDDSGLGTSQVIVIHSKTPLFDGVRPISESIDSYADAIRVARGDGTLEVVSLKTAPLITAAR